MVVQDSNTSCILVAIDFGTTYSGVAYSQSARPEVQVAINQWPDEFSRTMEGVTMEKVPTEIKYDHEDANEFRWGFQIKEGEERQKWIKLELDGAETRAACGLASQYPDKDAAPPSYSRTAEQMVTDYLKALCKHTVDILKHKFGEGAVNSTPFRYIVTVPAIWSDSAKAKTRRCAEQAGMGSVVQMISEPEAAAVYSLDMMDPHGLEIGDTFVVCDAGGGTVDLISYSVAQLKPVLHIREAAKGSGHLCGSSFLNRIFRKYLEDNFSRLRGWDEEVLEEAMEKFDKSTKRTYGGNPNDEYVIPMPGLNDFPHKNIRRGKLRMTGTQLGAIFDPVVKEVVTLVMDQIRATEKTPKAVLLVGGFGQSPFLRECIRKAIEGFSADIKLMQPVNGWTAVVRGALIKGLAQFAPATMRVNVDARITRKFYGLVKYALYDRRVHMANRKYRDSFDGRWRVDVMDWIVKKGKSCKEQESIVTSWERHQPVSDGPFKDFIVTLYICDDPHDFGAPMYDDTGNGVVKLADLKADFSNIPQQASIERGKDGQTYYGIVFEIHVNLYSAHTEYSLWYNGKSYDTINAEYY